jgi:hypothetical protein
VSSTHLRVILPSGNEAVYMVQQNHLHSREMIMRFGRHLATKFKDGWYNYGVQKSEPGLALLYDRVPLYDEQDENLNHD